MVLLRVMRVAVYQLVEVRWAAAFVGGHLVQFLLRLRLVKGGLNRDPAAAVISSLSFFVLYSTTTHQHP